jgi:hypothetical protein
MSWDAYCNLSVQGYLVPAGSWFICQDEHDIIESDLVYFTKPDGTQVGTNAGEVEIIDPVYGKVYP